MRDSKNDDEVRRGGGEGETGVRRDRHEGEDRQRKRWARDRKRGQEMTFHVILMELGPVGVATTATGGPDGAASSVRKKIAFDA